jgi:L-alanine-DL-glutamate epimerase-like enolase superfamily enzyme
VRIIAVRPFVLSVPLKKPITDAINWVPAWGVPGVLIDTDEGITGTGYTGTHSWGDHLFPDVIEQHFAETLLGEDPGNIKQLWQKLHWSRLHWVGRAGVVSMAHAAVDIALWDIAAQAAGMPLHRLLGTHKPDGVPAYNTDAGWLNWSVHDLLRDMSALLDEGWTAIKMKVGNEDWRVDFERVSEVRRSLGDGFRLMVDANQKWNLPTAQAFAQRAEELDLTWFEEPCHPDDVRAHAVLANTTSIPIALGENVYSKFAFRDFIDAHAVTYVQCDATRVSGITEWLDVAGLAACHNLPVVPHHGDFAQAQQHLVASHPAAVMMEYIPWLLDIFEEPIVARDGILQLPESPGATTKIREDAFEKFRVR